MAAYSEAVRRSVIHDSLAGRPAEVVAEKHVMRWTQVRALGKRWQETGDLTPCESTDRTTT